MSSSAEQLADAIEIDLLLSKQRARSLRWVVGSSHAAKHSSRPAALDMAVTILNGRARLLGELYPFIVTNMGVRRRDSALTSPYGALLLMTTGSPVLDFPAQETQEAAALFEYIVSEAAARLFGDDGEAVRFGYPNDVGRPPEFARAIPWLASRMGLQGGTAYRAPSKQDGGVDVVAWRPFPDRRSGFPIVLVQATLESNYVHKAADINSRLWGLLLGLDVDPSTVLAIPRTVPRNEQWNEVSTRSTLLERLRITGLLPYGLPLLSDERWQKLLQRLASSYLKQLDEDSER